MIPATGRQVSGQQARRQITIENAAGHALVLLHRTRQATRGVALATVTEHVDHVLAALPGFAFAFGRLQLHILAVHHVPAHQAQAHVEREAQAGDRGGALDRLDGFQVGMNRIGIGARHQVIRGVRHRRIQVRAIAAFAFGQRGEELVIAVQADAVLFARGDVGAVDRAERRHDRQAARVRRPTRCGVARHAVGGAGEVFALLDLRIIGVSCHHRRSQTNRQRQAAK
ncbi:hypothetical protein D9M71_407980 [compost metagenome]